MRIHFSMALTGNHTKERECERSTEFFPPHIALPSSSSFEKCTLITIVIIPFLLRMFLFCFLLFSQFICSQMSESVVHCRLLYVARVSRLTTLSKLHIFFIFFCVIIVVELHLILLWIHFFTQIFAFFSLLLCPNRTKCIFYFISLVFFCSQIHTMSCEYEWTA